MKQIIIILSLAFTYTATQAQIVFNTGSVEFDADLNIINTNANADLSAFKTDMSASFSVTIGSLDNMISIGMAPAEVYLALEIASIVNKPVDDVVVVYNKHKGNGWGIIAKEMGIKPGSDEFHALKGKCKNKKEKGNKGNKGNGH